MGATKQVSDEKLLEHFRTSGEPFLTVPEMAEDFTISRQAIDKRLKQLHEKGDIERKKTGHTTIWWLPDQPYSE